MRLIDANKLMESLNPKESVWVGLVLSELIANTTTVKAIPIEWIKSKKIEYEHDRYDYVRGCFDGFNDCIDYLIDEWEAENEAN